MKLSIWLRFLPLAAGLTLFNGCATPSPLNDLSIAIESIKPAASGSHSEADVTLHLVNANEVAAAIAHSTHKLYLNGNYVGKAEVKTPVPLPRMGTRDEQVTLRFENSAVAEKAISSAVNGTVPYRLDTEVFYDVEEDHQSTKVTQNGNLDVHALAQAWASSAH